jgi:inner membrane protein
MFKNRKSSLLLLALLVSLFAYIYQLIRLENTALLAGSVGLFVIVTATMYITRKVRWLESGSGEVEP